MANFSTWINFSIFYNHRNLHRLLREAMPAFLSELKATALSSEYVLFLSKERGEHLRVFLKVNPIDLLKIEEHVDRHLKTFIQKTPSALPDLVLPLETVFLPFSNNSIQYNCVNQTYLFYSVPKEYIIRNGISQAMLAALGDDEIDADAKLIFSLYMQLIYLSLYSAKDRSYCINNLYERCFALAGPELSGVIDRHVRNLSSSNLSSFIEIIEEVERMSKDTTQNWMRDWKSLCSQIVGDRQSLELEFPQIIQFLDEQLNIRNRDQLLIALALHKHLLTSVNEIFLT